VITLTIKVLTGKKRFDINSSLQREGRAEAEKEGSAEKKLKKDIDG